MHVDGARLAHERHAPHVLEQLATRQHAPDVAKQRAQKVEFLERELNGDAACGNGVLEHAQLDGPALQHIAGGRGRRRGAAQKRVHAADQLHHAERLGQIVVSAGIEAALAGSCDLGLSSRELSDDELSQGAVANVIAKDGVAVVVNPENPVTELTSEQIAKIFTGEITNWSELGGEDAEIAVFGRDSASGTRSAFEEILGIEDQCAYLNEYSSTGDVIGNVASNPNAIGYASLSAVDESVAAVSVDGVIPTEETVADGSFPIQRPFVVVTVEGTELSPAAQAFLDYAMSAEVADIIAAAGAVAANA